MPAETLAFISYAYPDNKDGFVTDLYSRLVHELQVQLGKRANVFLDTSLRSGPWEPAHADALERSKFLIPVVSPSYFKSDWCQRELDYFLEREQRVDRQLIFPVYYVDAEDAAMLLST